MRVMYIINLNHPLTEAHLIKIEAITGKAVCEIKEIPSQIDHNYALEPQIEALLEKVGFTAQQWQTEPFIVHLPALNYSASSRTRYTVEQVIFRQFTFAPNGRSTTF